MNVSLADERSVPEEASIDSITEKIIASAFKVSNTLGIGYVEKVYENAHAYQMIKDGLRVVQQYPFKVEYDRVLVGKSRLQIRRLQPSPNWKVAKP